MGSFLKKNEMNNLVHFKKYTLFGFLSPIEYKSYQFWKRIVFW